MQFKRDVEITASKAQKLALKFADLKRILFVALLCVRLTGLHHVAVWYSNTVIKAGEEAH